MRLVAAILALAGLIVLSVLVFTLFSIEVGFMTISIVVIGTAGAFFAFIYRYKQPKADQALVRTGGAKYKVRFAGGGLWINTIFHEVRPVSMNTMRLEIIRQGPEESLITGDFMRADVTAVFYVKVKPDEDNVIKAAQTLGQRTVPMYELKKSFSLGRRRQQVPISGAKEPEQDLMLENIKALLDDKVDGALRSVAATMSLEELQKDRKRFAEEVRTTCQPDLMENGLALETVTITMLNQTPVAEMDPDNRFDAEGIKEITTITKKAYKEKEQVVKDTDVAVTKIEVDASKQKFVLQQDKAWAEADMQMKITTYSATKEAETVKVSYEQELVGKKAGILKEQELSKAEIDKTREIEIAKVTQEQKVAERGIEKNLVVEIKTIEQSQKVQEREVQRELEIGLLKIDQEQKVQIKDFEKMLNVEKAKLSMEEGVGIRNVEKMLAISVTEIGKEQKVMEREIEKNKYVEIAQIEMGQKVQEREIERNLIIQKATYEAQVGIKDAEVSSLKKQYILEKDRAIVDADQKKIIQIYTATQKAEGTKVQYEQEAVERQAMITRDQVIMEREIDKNRVIEIAQIDMGQKVQVREIERNLVVQKATFEAQVGIKRADVDSQIKQFGLEQDRSWAEADQRKQIATYVAQRQAEAAQVQYEQDFVKETARISREQRVMEREIQKNLVVETAQINMGKQVNLVEIDQRLTVGLADEDRKIAMELKMQNTDLASKVHLEATALKNVADVNAVTVQRIGEAERDKEVAVINAEREAKPMERLAEAILAQAVAKAEGQKKMIEAKNVAEQRILVQQAILSLIETSPQLVERLMKPVEKIESIRILDMGGQGGTGGGMDKSAMGRLAANLMDTGSVMPMVKEFLKFADVNADDLAKKAAEYLSGLIKIQPKQ